MPIYNQLPNLSGNTLAAIDIETTGRLAGYHEIVQIAIVPLGHDLCPIPGVRPFNHLIRPEFKERADKEAMVVSGLNLEELEKRAADAFQVADWLLEWMRDLELPLNRCFAPLAHNWAFEKGFITEWLGLEGIGGVFYAHPRDTMVTAIYMNDHANMRGEQTPFPKVNLTDLCKKLGVKNEKAHDAYHDAIATAECYKRLVSGFGLKGLD